MISKKKAIINTKKLKIEYHGMIFDFFLSLQLINNIILYGVELRISDYRPKKLES